jgi:uracil DNA glycosylase
MITTSARTFDPRKQDTGHLPVQEDIFNSLNHKPYQNVKAVILGRTPTTAESGHGLASTVKKGVPNHRPGKYFKIAESDQGIKAPDPLFGGMGEAGSSPLTRC